jgi:tetratricopeptide (TPR) repeat protein
MTTPAATPSSPEPLPPPSTTADADPPLGSQSQPQPQPQPPSSDLQNLTISSSSSLDPLNNPFASLNDLCYELSSLQDLASRGSWRSILDKVNRARKLSLLSKPHENLTYLTYNTIALTKLRRIADALADLDSLDEDFDSATYRYETYPDQYPNRVGSMVPFALRWLQAELPAKLGKRHETLDRFYTLLHFVRNKFGDNDKSSTASIELWRKRENLVINSIISHHLGFKEFGVCLALIKDLISKSDENSSGIDAKAVLLSKLGYVQMQYGDLEGAKNTFGKIESMVNGESEVELLNLVSRNKALMYLVGKDYVSAVREYDVCIDRDSADVVAINNKALCLMYLRDLSDSIKALENALERVPTAALDETIVVNLCSMYELAYVNHSDIKRTLSNWIARVAPDDFDSSCTRI